MPLDSFVLAFTGIVIGLGVADLLQSLHKLLRAGPRVKWDWLTVAYAAYMLFGLMIFWRWQYGYPPAGEVFTLASFLPTFLFLGLSFLMVASALPDHVPEEGLDLRQFYVSTIRHRWGLLSVSLLANVVAITWGGVRYGPFDWVVFLSVSACALLALLALRFHAIWFHALVLGFLFSVSAYGNLLAPIVH